MFPEGKVAFGSGYVLDMSPGGKMKCPIDAERLAELASGPEAQYAGKGPTQVFLLLEVIWGTVRDPTSTDDCKRVWVVVQFQRNRRMATVWDLCPGLGIRGRVTGWALHTRCAFSNYTAHHRPASDCGIPAEEWWWTGPAQLCTLQYWLEFYRQANCTRELQTEVDSCPAGFMLNKKRSREIQRQRRAAAQ